MLSFKDVYVLHGGCVAVDCLKSQTGSVSSTTVQSPVHGSTASIVGACGSPSARLSRYHAAGGDISSPSKEPAGARAAAGAAGKRTAVQAVAFPSKVNTVRSCYFGPVARIESQF